MKGDQLLVYRKLWNLDRVYHHHGIDCGDGTVIHYRKPSEVVERTSFALFSKGSSVSVKQYINGFCYLPDVVLSRAESRLGEAKYSLFFNNCEHFATWCKTGISDSKQIREYFSVMGKFNQTKFADLLKQSFKKSHRPNIEQLTQETLDDIKIVWEQVQPEYQQTLTEIAAWEKVAKQALQNNREDLTRAALAKKRNYQRKAWDLESQLNELATMTENLFQ